MLRNFDTIIPKTQVEETFTATKKFFDLPFEKKDKLEWECPESNRGYVRQGRERVTQATSKEEIEKLRQQAPGQLVSLDSGTVTRANIVLLTCTDRLYRLQGDDGDR